MMDKYLDQIFSSYSWSDADAKERSSWSCSESEQPNDDNSSPTYMTHSNQSLDSMVAQDASSINIHDFESDAQNGQNGGKNCNTNASNGMVDDGSFIVENSALQYDVANVGLSNCEPSVFPIFNSDFESPSTIPQVWPIQSFKGISSSLSPGMEQQRHSFGMNDEYGDNGIYAMASNPNSLPALTTTEQGKQDLGNYSLPSFASAPQMAMAMPTFQSLPQTTSTAPSSECAIGTAKPRTRARRGQATDPHSIAERLRREKIADRMKNLQELVPNSNKTDKASMLDEIIEYVKFLQLQVKALSTSTQGTAEAVSPLITKSQQAKGANGSLISPSIGQVADISFNDVDLEQVVRLMETDMNKAMQHLQTKLGLCLMPIALAEAVAAEKESSLSPPPASPASGDRNKTNSNDVGEVQINSSSSSSSNSNSSLPDRQVKQEVNKNYFAAT